PVARPDLVGDPAEEQGAHGAERFAHVAPMVFHERARPAAMREPTAGVLAGVPRGLRDAVDRHVFDRDQPAHQADPKNSTRTGASAFASTLCCCPSSVCRRAFGRASASCCAVTASQGKLALPTSTRIGVFVSAKSAALSR